MVKKEARKVYKYKRSQFSYAEKLKLDDLLLIQFQRLALPQLSCALSFYPIEENNEVNTFIITDYLRFQHPGIQIAYPKTDVTHSTMQAIVCEEDEAFEISNYNILEPLSCAFIPPENIDLVLVPLLVCDEGGNRVGYGKGFYDRFLKQCRPDCVKVGLSYFEPIERIQDADEFDVPLNLCITPQKAYVF